ncbi:hypothetical protein EUGRSUZ_K00037 [Eucalyptus grandis]|uniref:Uncharacterized protein n=2 Tax=Eucalyptus grandis TaxID=71139 RepID=A0ACC3IQH5_EUCGR|nr:hypothetical protein EUGRSUZ_K00037 [Eucalyptus grandis]
MARGGVGRQRLVGIVGRRGTGRKAVASPDSGLGRFAVGSGQSRCVRQQLGAPAKGVAGRETSGAGVDRKRGHLVWWRGEAAPRAV